MRKQNLLKLAFTFMAVLMFMGVQAQTINHTDDAAYGTNYVEATTTTYQTVNLGFRLYVLPDPVYSPNYDGTGNAGTNLGTNSRWRWVTGVDYATGTQVKAAANQNWIDISPTATGTTNYWVLETHGLISCEGSAQSQTVTITGEPNITGFAGVGTSWDVLTPGTEFRRCATGADIGDVLNIGIAETGAPSNQYTYGITVSQQALDFNLDPIGGVNDVTATYGKAAATGALDAGTAQTHTIIPLPLIAANTPTIYTFTMEANSLYSVISMRSQLRAGIATAGYAVPATTITYTILPVPTTGPIFHIPNAF